MTTNERRVVHAVLRVGGALAVYQVRRAPPINRLGQASVFAVFGVALAEMLDGSRGTAELLRGAAEALRQLA